MSYSAATRMAARREGLRRARPLGAHERQPAVTILHLAVHEIQEGALQLLRPPARATRADLDLVHAPHRRHLGRGAGEEDLVRRIEDLALQRLLPHFHPGVARE